MTVVERFPSIHPEGGRVLVKQSMAMESDVNQIVARHVAHSVPFPEGTRARYGDFTGLSDFHDALNRVQAAEREFEALPAAVRELCGNDPGEFLRLVFDPAGRADLVELGLVGAAVPPAADVVPPVVPLVVVPPVEPVVP